MTELRITARSSGKKPNYKKTAAQMLARCREFYQDPENERAYQEWKARKEEQHEKAAV
jgi:cytochrome c-type biogenesis protein CcmE